jgi:hypothetical protein
MDHADFECLSWKEIFSLIDDCYKVNSFLVEKNVLISPNYKVNSFLVEKSIKKKGERANSPACPTADRLCGRARARLARLWDGVARPQTASAV